MALAITLFLIALFLIILCFAHYKIWRSRLIKKLTAQSSLLDTSMDKVECISIGPDDGPVFLLSHGGGSGYDNGFLYDFLIDEGFRVICPSKPGYLRTPLSIGKTFEEHADMLAAVLDSLDIRKKVAIAGVSLGGPAALQFALRHHDRTACLIMQDAVSHEYKPPEGAENSILGKLFLSSSGRKFLTWLMTLFSNLWPKSAFATYLQTETLYDKKKIKELSDTIMKDPSEIEKFKKFAEMLAPLDIRGEGMDNEMQYAKKLPRYPLEDIKAPVLVTQSNMDRDVVKTHGEFVANTAPNAETYYFDGCGHLFWFGEEWPKIKNKLITFLKNHVKT
jgi:pimeloyl-ACP methyl ester carboxylesterase